MEAGARVPGSAEAAAEGLEARGRGEAGFGGRWARVCQVGCELLCPSHPGVNLLRAPQLPGIVRQHREAQGAPCHGQGVGTKRVPMPVGATADAESRAGGKGMPGTGLEQGHGTVVVIPVDPGAAAMASQPRGEHMAPKPP